MARANLQVDEQVVEKFLAAQDTRNDEVAKQADVAEDFNTILANTFTTTEAAFGLLNMTDDFTQGQSWCMIVWIPEGCRVRDKMLYSSSREDLRKKLGLGYFKSDYPANQHEDLVWSSYKSSLDKNFDPDVLTETERLVLEEKVLSSSESNRTKATALGVIPFALSEEVQIQLSAFKANETNWLELNVVNEVIQLLNARTVDGEGGYSQYLDNNTACFLAANLKKIDGSMISFFIYFCPEETPVRTKMTMSSSKASVLAAATEQGVSFEKFVEVRGVEEIDEALAMELNPSTTTDANTSSSSSLAAAITHSKPSRPGKGKVRVAKFQADS